MNAKSRSRSTNKEPLWISLNLLDAMHTDLIEQYGGMHGVHDVRLIESAIDRPKNLWGYNNDSTIQELAATLAFGIAKNHGYRDGNKRTAFAAMAVFLKLNGYRLVVSEEEAVSAMVFLATDHWDQTRFSEWISRCSEAIKPTLVR